MVMIFRLYSPGSFPRSYQGEYNLCRYLFGGSDVDYFSCGIVFPLLSGEYNQHRYLGQSDPTVCTVLVGEWENGTWS